MATTSAMELLEAKYGFYCPVYTPIALGVLEDQRGNVVLSAAHPSVQDYLQQARQDLKLPRDRDRRVIALAALEVFYKPFDPAHWLLWGRREAPIVGALIDKLVLKVKNQAIYHGNAWNGSDTMLFTLGTQRHPDWINAVKSRSPWFEKIVAPGETWWAKEKKIRSGASRPTTRSATRPTRRVTRAKAAEDAAAKATAGTSDPPRKRTRAAAAAATNAEAGPSTSTPVAPRTGLRSRKPAQVAQPMASTPELSRTISSESTPTLATPPSGPAMSSPRIISRPTQLVTDSRDISPGSTTTAVEVIPMDPRGKGKASALELTGVTKKGKGRAAARVIAKPAPTTVSTRPSRVKTPTAKAALGKRKADPDSELAAPAPRRKSAKRA